MQLEVPDAEYKGAPSLIFREVASHPADFSRVQTLRVHSSPMLLLAGCFAIGILCRAWWQPPLALVFTCAALLVLALLARTYARRVAWPATAAAFLALGWSAALLQPSRQDTSLLRYADGLQRTLEARVISTRVVNRPAQVSTEHDALRDVDEPVVDREIVTVRALRIEEIDPDASVMRDATGNVLLTLGSRDTHRVIPYLGCGSHIRVTVRMRAPQRYRTPGAWNYADAMEREGTSVVSVADVSSVKALDPVTVPLQCRFLTAQHWSSERIAALARAGWMRYLPPAMQLTVTDAAVLRAMLLGDRSDLDRGIRIDFERTASFHLFVVAGVHVTLLMAALYGVLRRLGVPLWGAVALTIPVVTGYACLTGFGEPVQRALLMSIIFLVTNAVHRERQILNALGVAALTMLVIDPHALTEASFQMTALSVIAVGGIAAPILGRTIGPWAQALKHIDTLSLDMHQAPYRAQLRVSARMAGRMLVRSTWKRGIPVAQRVPAGALRGLLIALEACLLTLIAETVMALPMAVYFHRLTPFAAPANVLALPLIGVLLACAMATFLLAVVHPVVAAVPVIATAVLLHAVNATIHAFSTLHGADVRIPAPIPLCIVVAVALWCVATVCVREYAPHRAFAGIAAVILAFLAILLPPKPRVTEDGMSFTAIDVGQGDSLLVTAPGGQTLVIDAGGPTGPQERSASSRFDTGEDVVSPFLWHHRLQRIDVLAVTHAHSDHLGGALSILQNFRPRELWLSVPLPALQPLVDEARRRNVPVRYLREGNMQELGAVRITALSPAAGYAASTEPSNDDSLVMRLQYGKSSVIAMGDAERDAEATMLTRGMSQVTLLKVGHHGSSTSTTQELLQKLQPRYAVISCGRGNRFGHPRMPILQRLQAGNVLTSRTDIMGTVTYVLHADGTVATSVPAPE